MAVARPVAQAREVYEPHRAGIPKLGPYVDGLWRRRGFAVELSRSTMRAAHSTTFFGQLWLVLNPTLNAAVYYLLVVIIAGGKQGPDYFVHLLAGLFAFNLVSQAMSSGAGSVVGGGKLVLNTAFPRLLLPLSAVRTAYFRFLPTMGVFFAFFVFFIVFGPYPTVASISVPHVPVPGNTLHFSWMQLLALPALGLIIVFSCGLAALFGALQVYFRDMTSFLPYLNRIWLYLSPVLYFPEQLPARILKFESLNPLYSLFGVWGDTLVRGEWPGLRMWAAAAAWAFGTFVVGSLFFMSREREFSVRI